MAAAPDDSTPTFRNQFTLSAGIAVTVVAIYLWALFTAQTSLLTTLGIVGFGLLLLCPAFVAYQTVRLTLQTGADVPVRDSIRLSLRRSTRLLLVDALVAVPVCVF